MHQVLEVTVDDLVYVGALATHLGQIWNKKYTHNTVERV